MTWSAAPCTFVVATWGRCTVTAGTCRGASAREAGLVGAGAWIAGSVCAIAGTGAGKGNADESICREADATGAVGGDSPTDVRISAAVDV